MDSAYFRGWDRVIAHFLKSAGLVQALHGFENDMLVMNSDFEKEEIPEALRYLQQGLTRLPLQPDNRTGDQRLQYVHLTNGAAPVSQTQLLRTISTLLAQNKRRNNASNRNEFLRKRRRVELAEPTADTAPQEGSSSKTVELPTCARTDAVPVNRDLQMKYDIAKNEDGPLRRTMRAEHTNTDATTRKPDDRKGKEKMASVDSGTKPSLERHPGLVERFSNLESHLAVRYVPSPPASLLDRIRFIEDHIMRLERDYPPWAALHFNQPNRDWPPPPKTTPIIVPTHLTSNVDQGSGAPAPPVDVARSNSLPVDVSQIGGTRRNGPSRPKQKAKSSLHRAVMDRIEVEKALAGES